MGHQLARAWPDTFVLSECEGSSTVQVCGLGEVIMRCLVSGVLLGRLDSAVLMSV